jgi:hypothetical protein
VLTALRSCCFDLAVGDLAACILEVVEHDAGRDIGEAEILVFEDLQAAGVDSFEANPCAPICPCHFHHESGRMTH